MRLKYQAGVTENSGFFLTSDKIFSSLRPLALIFWHGLDAKSKGCALRISYRTVEGSDIQLDDPLAVAATKQINVCQTR